MEAHITSEYLEDVSVGCELYQTPAWDLAKPDGRVQFSLFLEAMLRHLLALYMPTDLDA